MRVAEVDAAATTDLRRTVLRPAWAPGTPMAGDDDPEAVHIAALSDDGHAIGACVLFPRSSPHRADAANAWQLRGMATTETHRGQGVGAAVLGAAVVAVRTRGATLLWCKARVTAAAFYAAHGFIVDGPGYVEPETGLDHVDMSRPV